MIPQQNYRVDNKTGAVIFKPSAGRRKYQQMEKDVKLLMEKVDKLEKQNSILFKLLNEMGVLTEEIFSQLNSD